MTLFFAVILPSLVVLLLPVAYWHGRFDERKLSYEPRELDLTLLSRSKR